MSTGARIILTCVLVGLVGTAAILGWTQYLASKTIFENHWKVEYGKLPENDNELLGWLKGQPGVENASVQRNGKTIEIRYEIRPGTSLPDVLAQAESLGYSQPSNTFGQMLTRRAD